MTEHVANEKQYWEVSPDLAQRVLEETGQNVFLCYQCIKCTSGCPIAEFLDWQPNQIMRAIQLGQEDIAFESQTPWLCATCQTCTTRCPQELDITRIMEFLTREAVARGHAPQVQDVADFNRAFLREVRIWGRAYEPGLMAEMKLRQLGKGNLLEDVPFYMKMLRKRKVSFLPSAARPPRKVKPIAEAAKAVAYYPGCSLHSTATEFNASAKATCEALDITLIEPPGWVCCGSSAAHKADPEAAYKLPLENLSIIEQSGFEEVTMPCAACFNRHKTAQYEFSQHGQQSSPGGKDSARFRNKVRVNTLVETVHAHSGGDGVRNRVTRPLNGLRVACYYGCLLTRPPHVTGVEHYENPTDMDEIMTALGAEIVDWSYKTSCCGAAHALTRPDIVLTLSGRLISEARNAGADVIAVACPLCHMNLDARQFQMDLPEPVPILYFTQLMALAFGLPKKATALHKNIVDPEPVLQDKGLLGSYQPGPRHIDST